MAWEGKEWPEMQQEECQYCKDERNRRNRLLEEEDARVRQEPFVSAPFIHKNNEPKYHAMLLRAAEQANTDRKYTLWIAARDIPENPTQIAKTPEKVPQRLQRFLQYHDQQTAGVPGLNIVYEGMQARVTEKLVKRQDMVILKHSPGDRRRIDGAERLLNYLPKCIFLKFEGATWVVDVWAPGFGLCTL